MSKSIRVLIVAALLVGLIGPGGCWLARSRSRATLAKYKAELRAKGEKLSAAELGYPKLPETGTNLDRLIAAAEKVKGMRFQPATLDFMPFTGPGQVRLVWAAPVPVLLSPSSATWEAIATQFADECGITEELRAAVQTPPRYFYNDPTNFLNAPKSPFVGIRNAAQWLAADALVALRGHHLEEAGRDIRALAQLSRFHREDYTLVSQMIRVAVAGLGLSVTWQAMQAEGWSEESLAGMQQDWESVNLMDAFETGMLGERAFGAAYFDMMRSASSRERMKFLRGDLTQLRTPMDYFEACVAMPCWSASANADEMLFLQHHQRVLDSIRKLPTGVPWSDVDAELSSRHAELDQTFNSPLAKFRYLLSAVIIPNSARGARTCVRHETQRRLTVTALALERHKLGTGQYPSTLSSLVPQFLAAVPLDPMNAKPLGHRLNPDGTYTLYSAGEDGRDDGGEATSGSATNKFDLWTGRDAVWPVAVR